MLYVMRSRWASLSTLALSLFLIISCSEREKKMDETILDAVSDRAHYVAPPPDHPVESQDLKSVFFDSDRSSLNAAGKEALRFNSEWIKAHPTAKVQIEGHCDDRGTQDYNLPLGDKRAQAALDYLVELGVEAARLSTVSYGKEGASPSQKEWARSRRAGFYVIYDQVQPPQQSH